MNGFGNCLLNRRGNGNGDPLNTADRQRVSAAHGYYGKIDGNK
jgi:hypothetical protein